MLTKITHIYFRIMTLLFVCLAITGCVSTVVGAVVDTTIEVVKVPFKVGGAIIDAATGDDNDFTDLADQSTAENIKLSTEAAATKMENAEIQ